MQPPVRKFQLRLKGTTINSSSMLWLEESFYIFIQALGIENPDSEL